MASEIRVDKINSLSGVGTVTLSPTGVDIAGITTAATLRATTGIVTSLTAGSLTSLGAVSGTTGTFTGNVAVSGANITLQDSGSASDDRIALGAGSDLQFYHNSTHSYFDNQTGKLHIRNNTGTYHGNGIHIQPLKDEESVVCNPNGAVKLFHDNSERLATTGAGISVTQTSGGFSDFHHGGSNSGIRIAGPAASSGANLVFANNFDNSVSDEWAIQLDGASDDLLFKEGGATGNEKNRFSETGGILFNGDTATANALDDYEEGTFTFSLGHSLTPTDTDGTYTKIGNFCIAAGSVTFPNTADGNHAILGGLPFTSAGGRPGGAIVRYSNDNEAYKISWHVNAGAASASPYYTDGGGTTANVYLSGRRLDLIFCYRTA